MSVLEPFRPSAANPWNKTLAAHLLNRTTFAALPEDIKRVADDGLEKSVDRLMDFLKKDDAFAPPQMPDNPKSPAEIREMTKEERQALLRQNREAVEQIRGWWIRRMLKSPYPLQEKLTLFWHGHFATSANDVKSAPHMLMQNQFLRAHCLGNFRDLVLGISRDPAMLKYLDNNTNRKSHPNENYARELMELFTMGIGNYTEDDVKAAARAFTGWTFRGDDFVFERRQHDDGVKTFLGETGRFDGTDVIDIILRKPATAKFIARKLFAFFVYDNPEPSLAEQLGARLRQHKYEIKPFLRELLTSQALYSPAAYRTQIKSPAQLVIGSARLLDVEIDERALAVAMRGLGQDLLFPPNVKGWDGGEAWINTTTLLMRYNLSRYLLTGKLPDRGQPPNNPRDRRALRVLRTAMPHTELNKLVGVDVAADAAKLVDTLTGRMLQAKFDDTARQWLIEQAETTRVSERAALVTHLIMSMPDYQLC